MTNCAICKRRVTGDPIECKRCKAEVCVLHATSINQFDWLCDKCDALDDAGDDPTDALTSEEAGE